MPAAATVCGPVGTPPVSLSLVSLAPVLCAAPHSIPPPPPTRTYRFATSCSCYCTGICGWLRGGGCALCLPFWVICSMHHRAGLLPSPLWSCPLARHGHPHGRHLCGLACVESEGFDLKTLPPSPFLPYNMHALLLALLLLPSATITHDHQKEPRLASAATATTTTTKQATPSLSCLLAVNVKRCFSSLPFPYTNYSLPRHVRKRRGTGACFGRPEL